MLPIYVERASLDEMPAIWEIYEQVAGTHSQRAVLMDAVQERRAFVAKQGFAVRGFAVRNTSFFGYPFITHLVTHPDYRRQGVARALLAYIEKTTPADRLFTSSAASNTIATHVLRAFGFRRSGMVYNVNRNGDTEIIFVKMLIP